MVQRTKLLLQISCFYWTRSNLLWYTDKGPLRHWLQETNLYLPCGAQTARADPVNPTQSTWIFWQTHRIRGSVIYILVDPFKSTNVGKVVHSNWIRWPVCNICRRASGHCSNVWTSQVDNVIQCTKVPDKSYYSLDGWWIIQPTITATFINDFDYFFTMHSL